jgi:hypothetical protein
MALLQIAEPGLSTLPHQHRLAVGIDLGTTNSLVATVRSGLAVVLDDAAGRSLLPSVVRYHANGTVDVGYAAQAAQNADPGNTIASVKRFMGRGLSDIEDVASLPYQFVDALQGQQVQATVYRMLQRLVGLVHPRRPLHREPLLGVRLRREAVGMHRLLQVAVGGVEPVAVERKGLRQAEQLEVVLAEIHFQGLAARSPDSGACRASSTEHARAAPALARNPNS